jgi:hypothetical protein
MMGCALKNKKQKHKKTMTDVGVICKKLYCIRSGGGDHPRQRGTRHQLHPAACSPLELLHFISA